MIESFSPTSTRHLTIHSGVRRALEVGRPVVALETAVVTHGLPSPQNIHAIETMQREIRQRGAEPATCLAYGGSIHVGAPDEMVVAAAADEQRQKASVRDLAAAVALGTTAGLTVSATLCAAHLAGIHVFATGGIGGVHRGFERTGDVSADLAALAQFPVITVCAGAKSVLDIPRTLEHLESLGVPVFAYGAHHFPAFYVRSSGQRTPCLQTPEQVAEVASAHWSLGLRSSLVIGNPLPEESALDPERLDAWMAHVEEDAAAAAVTGQDVTPDLLDRLATVSGGATVTANLELLRRNAALAADIALHPIL